MASTIQRNEQVQVRNTHDHVTIPREVFLSCATAQARMNDIEQQMQILIEDSIVGDTSRVEAIIAQIDPKKKIELELMARVLIAKALDEPQHCKACVSLSGALHVLLPALPSGYQGKKGETFMHALLDVFQTEFEAVFTATSAQDFSGEDPTTDGRRTGQRDSNRIRAIVHFAGHLYCFRLLGNGVVSQMVQELVDNGEPEAANELLWFIGFVTNSTAEQQILGTVLEDDGQSDGGSSEAKSHSDRRPSGT